VRLKGIAIQLAQGCRVLLQHILHVLCFGTTTRAQRLMRAATTRRDGVLTGLGVQQQQHRQQRCPHTHLAKHAAQLV
jgi:hypothetical protein